MKKILQAAVLILVSLFYSCSQPQSNNTANKYIITKDESLFIANHAKNVEEDSLARIAQYRPHPLEDSLYRMKLDLMWQSQDAKKKHRIHLKGIILPNLEDSTILKAVYGNWMKTDTIYEGGIPIPQNENKIVARISNDLFPGLKDMRVEVISFSNNDIYFVSLGGVDGYLGSHPVHSETELTCLKRDSVWKIIDFYKDSLIFSLDK